MPNTKILPLILFVPCLNAAPVPDAGQISRQQEAVNPHIDRMPAPKPDELEIMAPADNEVSIEVKSIDITGGEKLESRDVLQSLVADAIGQKLGFAQLQLLAERISRHLKAKGWPLVKAYLPKQDVTEGRIRIDITQGRLETDQEGHGLHIERGPDTRLRNSVIQERFRYVISGETLDGKELDRALLLLNDLPGVQARATLEKSPQPGASRLSLNVKEAALMTGNFSIDDFGNRFTGTWRGNLNGSLNDALGIGDQLSIGGTGAENLGMARGNYSLPIGGSGLQTNLHYSYLGYNIGLEFESLNSQGTAENVGNGLSYPLIRSRDLSLWASADYTHKTLRNSSLNVVTSDKLIDNGSIGFNGQTLDTFLGGGFSMLSYAATLGGVDLGNVQADLSADQSTARTQGVYDKHNFSFARLQKLSELYSFYVAGSAQLAGKNLTSAEKFILGGPTGIRAYPVGEGSGDSGWVANFELRYDVPYPLGVGNLQLEGFFDTGHVVLSHQPWSNSVTNATGRNQYGLSGSGMGVNFTSANRFVLRGVWAHTIGDNPGRSAAGNNSDGQKDSNLFWLQSTLNF